MRRRLRAGAAAVAASLFFGALLAACGASAPPPVIDSFTAAPESTSPGGVVQLSWSVRGATKLSIDKGVGDVTGKVSVNATITATTVFSLTASSGGASVTRQVTVTMVSPPPLIRLFGASPPQVLPGGAVTLSWSVANAVTVLIDGQPVTSVTKLVNPTATTKYTLSVIGFPGTTAPAPATTVARVAAAPIVSAFFATPSTVTLGQAATLTWTSSPDALGFAIDNGVGNLGLQTRAIVRPAQTTTYTLTASGPLGSAATRTAMVTVNPAAGTRALVYTAPASVPADALLALVADASSTPARAVLTLVTTKAASASALAFALALDGSRVTLDAAQAGDVSPGFSLNPAALDPGSAPAAAKASLQESGPLANVLTFGIARKPAGGGALPGDQAIPVGTEVCRFRLVIAPGAGPGPVFPLAVDAGHPDPSDAYKPYRALLRAGSAPSSTLPPTVVALGALELQ